jgi:hypothetical protein
MAKEWSGGEDRRTPEEILRGEGIEPTPKAIKRLKRMQRRLKRKLARVRRKNK